MDKGDRQLSEIEKLQMEFASAPVPDYTEEDYRKMYEIYTEKIHPAIEAINLRQALSKATAHTRIRRGL